VHNHAVTPISILRAYGKAALLANAKTNCLTEIMIPSAEASLDQDQDNPIPKERRSLAGVPVSLKDMINVAGYDTSIGMTCKTFNPAAADAPLVRLLRDAGATLYVKTTVPITMLSFETTSPLWGTTTNVHNAAFSPGGSSGGDAALISFGGARVGVGSDLAGSVRVPAHFSGIFSLKCSSGRWPKTGIGSAGPGQEGVPSVLSPMARTMEDLTYFTRSVVQMQPWTYDHGVLHLPWREELAAELKTEENRRKIRVGIMRSDGVVDPSPACARAVDIVASSLHKAGFDVHDVVPPRGDVDEFSPFAGLLLASQLINSDGCRTTKSLLQPGEWLVEGAAGLLRYISLPQVVKRVYLFWIRYVRRDPMWADLLAGLTEKSCFEQWKLVSKRELFRARWFEWWRKEENLDFLITAPNATPAIPHGAMRQAGASCSYAVLFNLVCQHQRTHVPFSS
jgi:Asp-tRNA(Asn)/Glu-tRNA(Gln) amidotransferase A subunit family amidase